jgi:hypothetical protein
MKKSSLLSVLIGYLCASLPVLAMLDKEEEHRIHIHQQTIGNQDIMPLVLERLDTIGLARAPQVCKLWEKCSLSEQILEYQRRKVLALFEERSYCESLKPIISGVSITDSYAALSFSVLHDIWTNNKDLFPLYTGEFRSQSAPDNARCRAEYSIGLICGPQVWDRHNPVRTVQSDEFICDEAPLGNISSVVFLGAVLKKSKVDSISLKSGHFRSLQLMSDEIARSLGEAVKCSSLTSIQLKDVYCGCIPTLPTFLVRAAKNPKLTKVDLSYVGVFDEGQIDALIALMPDGLSFELILPEHLTLESGVGIRSYEDFCASKEKTALTNARLREKLTDHFKDKVKFVNPYSS